MWLKLDTHFVNMAHVLMVHDDPSSVPPCCALVFADNVRLRLTGVDRMDVLEHLEGESRQEPYVLGETLMTLDPPAPYTKAEPNGLELHITAPDVTSFRETMQAMMAAAIQEARATPQVFRATQDAIDYAIRLEGD